MTPADGLTHDDALPLRRKLARLNWLVVLVLCGLAGVGLAMLYSAAGGSAEPWAINHGMRFVPGLVGLLVIALIDPRLWLRLAYLGYGGALALVAAVEIMGVAGMGAQRWIDLGVVNLQPSEIMKLALILGLARYFHGRSIEEIARPSTLIAPLMMVAVPVALVLRQPDLGTAAILLAIGAAVFFTAGVRLWKFVVVGVAALGSIPLIWQALAPYQQSRVLTFLNPGSDPSGAGYHILQSKIALGSGGLTGKGYLNGSQGHLNFLPEKQTDFIFTMFAEEFGLLGSLALLAAFTGLILWGLSVGMRCQSQFTRLVALGATTNLFLYMFINMAMVMGLIPVVGVPLPLISYGGTGLMTVLAGFGLMLGCSLHRELRIPRRAAGDPLD